MIYHAKTKHEVLVTIEKMGFDPDKEYNNLTDAEQEDGITDWVIVTAKCRVCDHKMVCICPSGLDYNNMECHKCHNMTASEEYDRDEMSP